MGVRNFYSKIIFEGLTKDGSPFSLPLVRKLNLIYTLFCFYQSDSIYMYKDGLNESSIARPTGGLAEKPLFISVQEEITLVQTI